MVSIDDVSWKLKEEEFAGKSRMRNYIVLAGVDYYCPIPVLKDLQTILGINAEVKAIKVIKKGTTKEDTTYTVMVIN